MKEFSTDQHLDELEIEVINNLVTLGITYANEAVASGMRSWHPHHQEKMHDLAGPQAKIATEALKKLKGETS